MKSHRETERTYEPPAEAMLPDLSRLDGVKTVDPPSEFQLEATYFDTPELDLFAHHVTLRRRTGGDEGWHLKLPAGEDTREEVRLPLSRARHLPPKALRDLVLALSRGEPLVPVATIRTHRTETALRSSGAILAEVADDQVTARRLLPGEEPRLVAWREWEVELVDAAPELLEAVNALLTEAGAGVADVQTKLGRVVGDAAPTTPGVCKPAGKKPVARVLHVYLIEQVEQVLAADRAVRRRQHDGIHDLRVALRRLRTTLATFRSLVDREVTDPLRDEMRWVSHTLGSARDTEVVHERLHTLLADEPPNPVTASARRALGQAARLESRDARRVADETLRSQRYLDVIGALHRLVKEPPWVDEAERRAEQVLPTLLAQDLRRMQERVQVVQGTDDAMERTERIHEVRKSAKRLRYACEVAAPVLGSEAGTLEGAAKHFQSLLGDHHDTVLTRSWLLHFAADSTPEGVLTLGRLHAREEAEATRLERAFAGAWAKLERRSG